MFAYLVIAFELAILYTVFWYIFLREPKPFKVAGNIWGQYDNGSKFAGSQIDPTLPIQTRQDWMTLNEMYYSEYCGNRSRPQFRRGIANAKVKLPRISRNPSLNYGWVLADEQQQHEAVPQFLNKLQNTLEELRLKIPK
jgi:hypothetical protein